MEVSTHFHMLTGLNEFCQKSFQFCVPLNKVGEVTLQILLSKRKEKSTLAFWRIQCLGEQLKNGYISRIWILELHRYEHETFVLICFIRCFVYVSSKARQEGGKFQDKSQF